MQFRSSKSFSAIARLAIVCGGLGVAALMSGCAMTETAKLMPQAGEAFGGKAVGGQQPIAGAAMSVVAVGLSGYGGGSTTLATTTTDANGNWSFPANSYTCPTATTPILITARGGNPGLASGTNNTAIYLVSYAGPCGQLTPQTFFIINEVTTVAAAYVLRPFMNTSVTSFSATNAVGFSATNTAAPSITFASYKNLVSNSRGASPGDAVPAGVVIPTARINTLANAMAACVNTDSASSANCTTYLGAAGYLLTGGVANTWVATSYLAYNPAANPTAIMDLGSPSPPFQPTLTSTPGDFSLIVTHTAGNLKTASVGLDIDSNNNIWVATKGGFAGAVDVISPDGTVLKSNILNGVVDGIQGISADFSGGALILGNASGDSGAYHVSSTFQTTCQYVSQSELPNPAGAVYTYFPASNPVPAYFGWVVSDASRKTLNVLNDSCVKPGSSINSTITPASIGSTPGYVWNFGGTSLERYVPDAFSQLASKTTSSVGDTGPSTFDRTQWYVASTLGDNTNGWNLYLGGISSASLNSNGYTYFRARALESDGFGNIWLTNSDDNAAPLLQGFLAGSVDGQVSFLQAYSDTPSSRYNGLIIDVAGNLWLTRDAAGGLSEVIGAAEPTVVPLAKNGVSGTWAKRP